MQVSKPVYPSHRGTPPSCRHPRPPSHSPPSRPRAAHRTLPPTHTDVLVRGRRRMRRFCTRRLSLRLKRPDEPRPLKGLASRRSLSPLADRWAMAQGVSPSMNSPKMSRTVLACSSLMARNAVIIPNTPSTKHKRAELPGSARRIVHCCLKFLSDKVSWLPWFLIWQAKLLLSQSYAFH